jgi:hypothetical protein
MVANGVPDRSAWEIGNLTSAGVSTRDIMSATKTLPTQIEGVRLRGKGFRENSVGSERANLIARNIPPAPVRSVLLVP